jgi:hypothetical protein
MSDFKIPSSPVFVTNLGYRDRQAWERRNDDERVKPLDGVQLVKVQPGQRRSGQTGSESCACVG